MTDYERAQDQIESWKRSGSEGSTLFLCDLKISKLPPLPHNLKDLYIQNTEIEELPEVLPPTLHTLICYSTKLKKLPSSLPSTLTRLYLACCNLTEISVPLPETLIDLYINRSQIAKLPPLPSRLDILRCENMPLLTELPELPDTLDSLCISDTRISKLPDRLPARLRLIYMENTPIRKLPAVLPEWLRIIGLYPAKNMPLTHYLPALIDEVERGQAHHYHARVTRHQQFVEQLPEVFEKRESRRRSTQRCKAIKEDLMAATWHPDRVLEWCDPKAFDYEN
jgi:Leucine-rich repeat (LRR) protein